MSLNRNVKNRAHFNTECLINVHTSAYHTNSSSGVESANSTLLSSSNEAEINHQLVGNVQFSDITDFNSKHSFPIASTSNTIKYNAKTNILLNHNNNNDNRQYKPISNHNQNETESSSSSVSSELGSEETENRLCYDWLNNKKSEQINGAAVMQIDFNRTSTNQDDVEEEDESVTANSNKPLPFPTSHFKENNNNNNNSTLTLVSTKLPPAATQCFNNLNNNKINTFSSSSSSSSTSSGCSSLENPYNNINNNNKKVFNLSGKNISTSSTFKPSSKIDFV
jgi:hypothetical protein